MLTTTSSFTYFLYLTSGGSAQKNTPIAIIVHAVFSLFSNDPREDPLMWETCL